MRAARGLVSGDTVERRGRWFAKEQGVVIDPACGPTNNYAEVFWVDTGDLTLVAHSSVVLRGPIGEDEDQVGETASAL